MTTSPPGREDPVASHPADASAPVSPARFALRPEVQADAPFRLALFRASRGSGWDQLSLPADVLATLMEQQFNAQTRGYASAFPEARLEIVTVDAAPVGRLATHREGGGVHLIDIALVPEARGQGIGEAILRALMAEATAAGTSVTLQVARDNLGAQRLYHRLGFALASANETHLTLAWPAQTAAPGAA